MERIAVLGAGGHARVVIDALEALGRFEVVGVVVPDPDATAPVFGRVPVLGDEEALERLLADGVSALAMGVGSVGDVSARERTFERARSAGFTFPAIVHPSASVSPEARLGEGVFVAAHAVVGPGSSIGFGCIVNSGAVVDHDCTLGELVHVAPGVAMSGGCTVGRAAHIGTGASVAQGISIGAEALIGVGAAVVEDVAAGVVAYGVPCREVRRRD